MLVHCREIHAIYQNEAVLLCVLHHLTMLLNAQLSSFPSCLKNSGVII